MNNIIISHINGDISLDKLQKLIDEISLVQHKDELAFTTNTTQALINKIVEQNAIIQDFESKEEDRFYDEMDKSNLI